MIKCVWHDRKLMLFFGLVIVFLIVFLLYGLFIPVRLEVTKMPSPYYWDIHLDGTNTEVSNVSLFGLRFPASDVYSRQMPDGTVTVWSKGLSCEVHADIVMPKSVKVWYDADSVYAGQPVDASKVHVKAVYENGKRDVSWFRVSGDIVPLSSEVSVPIQLACGAESLNVPVTGPREMRAEYNQSCKMGDMFQRDAVSVQAVYPDGTESAVSDFLIPDAPKYISDDTSVTVVTDYGTAHLDVVPDDAQPLTVSYDGDLYVGDKIQESHIRMMLGEKQIDSSEFTHVDDLGVLKTQAEILVCSKYGNAVLKLDPIGIRSCEAEIEGEAVENGTLEVGSIKLVYGDDSEVWLMPDEYEITSQIDKISAGKSRVWFLYQGMHLYFGVNAVPESVVSLRDSGVELPDDVPVPIDESSGGELSGPQALDIGDSSDEADESGGGEPDNPVQPDAEPEEIFVDDGSDSDDEISIGD